MALQTSPVARTPGAVPSCSGTRGPAVPATTGTPDPIRAPIADDALRGVRTDLLLRSKNGRSDRPEPAPLDRASGGRVVSSSGQPPERPKKNVRVTQYP